MIENVKLIPSSGGRFEVLAGETVIYSKKAVGRHAEEGEVVRRFGEVLGIEPTPRK